MSRVIDVNATWDIVELRSRIESLENVVTDLLLMLHENGTLEDDELADTLERHR